MQNTQYENTVIAAIEYFAGSIKGCAHDSVVETFDYGIYDSTDSIQWLMANYTQHNTVRDLAAAALNSSLDTVVRESIHYALTTEI